MNCNLRSNMVRRGNHMNLFLDPFFFSASMFNNSVINSPITNFKIYYILPHCHTVYIKKASQINLNLKSMTTDYCLAYTNKMKPNKECIMNREYKAS